MAELTYERMMDDCIHVSAPVWYRCQSELAELRAALARHEQALRYAAQRAMPDASDAERERWVDECLRVGA